MNISALRCKLKGLKSGLKRTEDRESGYKGSGHKGFMGGATLKL